MDSELNATLSLILSEMKNTNAHLEQIDSRLNGIDSRLDKLEQGQELLLQQSLAHTQAIHAVSNDLATIRDNLLERMDAIQIENRSICGEMLYDIARLKRRMAV